MTVSVTDFLNGATIDSEVHQQHPTYCALLLIVEGTVGGSSDDGSEAILLEAEKLTADLLSQRPLEDLEEIKEWRSAYASFGVKPRVAKSSIEALIRRSSAGLPRVNRLTDLYNAISIKHRIPVGGEDLDAYVGAPRLTVANGNESFDTVADGQPIDSSPEVGEIVWQDDSGVTCRRWNWRQCSRTRLTQNTTRSLFIFDGLGNDSEFRIQAAADELVANLEAWWPSVNIASRLMRKS